MYSSKPPPVRFANPFDPAEVFEFPPGTSPEYAREAVAEFLIDRARDRHVRHEHEHRSRIHCRTRPKYCSSVTFSIHSIIFPSSASTIAM